MAISNPISRRIINTIYAHKNNCRCAFQIDKTGKKLPNKYALLKCKIT
jgi:hypothetical protein